MESSGRSVEGRPARWEDLGKFPPAGLFLGGPGHGVKDVSEGPPGRGL